MGLCDFCFSKSLGLDFCVLQMSTFFFRITKKINFYIAILA